MSNVALVQYDEFRITAKNLRALPLEHVAGLAALEYAVSEVNALRRIFLSQSHDYTGEKTIDEASSIQRLVILRTWSSKLFEAKEFLGTLCGNKSHTKDPKLNALALEALDDLEASTIAEGYEVARDVRHEASNHYLFSAAKKNVAYLHDDALCNMYLHRHGGNDFFPMGEAVMFHGRLHRRWKNTQSLEDRQKKFEQWIDWCMGANESLIRSHARFANTLVFMALGRNEFIPRNYWVPEALVGHPLKRMTPVFFRSE